MQEKITADLVKGLKTKEKPYEVWDTEIRGFIIRVQPSGAKIYLVEYARHKRISIGQATVLSAAKAREKAKEKLGDYIHGIDPMEERKKARAHTLETFVQEKYQGWVEAHQKHPKETLRRLALFYPILGNKKLAEIDAWSIERFRSARLKDVKPLTVNHDLDVLRAALNKAIEWRLLDVHPMRTIRRSKVDTDSKIRYLTADEANRLRNALDARETKRRQERESFNRWRRTRGYEQFPEFGAFTDHLKPMVLVALNTGMRRGELFNLKWEDINFPARIATVVGATAKSGKTRHIPLNEEALDVLENWQKQKTTSELVFPGHDGNRMDNISTSWAALIQDAKMQNFRFHDCRHDFASKLVMAGVDLNTVRELLGHSDIKMTLRYAHLAPEKLAAAVAKLVAS